jgi:hypothetical protein
MKAILVTGLFLSGLFLAQSCEKDPEIKHLELTLQPEAEQGKDALVGKIVPISNYGETPDLHLYAWTQGGVLNVNRALLEFDLNALPLEAQIDSAFLSVFFNSTSLYGDQHEGETSFVIQRIISEWDEMEVSWSTQPDASTDNQRLIEGASYGNQSFTGLDVTSLVRDMSDDRINSHGFLLRLNEEAPYRKLLLASSDHPLEELRPRLVIYYTLDS